MSILRGARNPMKLKAKKAANLQFFESKRCRNDRLNIHHLFPKKPHIRVRKIVSANRDGRIQANLSRLDLLIEKLKSFLVEESFSSRETSIQILM